MRRHAVSGLIALGIAGLTLTGCDSTTMHCSADSCEVTVKGTATVDRPGGSHGEHGQHSTDTWFKVKGYRAHGLRIASGGDTENVKEGETETIGGTTITVKSAGGQSAELHLKK